MAKIPNVNLMNLQVLTKEQTEENDTGPMYKFRRNKTNINDRSLLKPAIL